MCRLLKEVRPFPAVVSKSGLTLVPSTDQSQSMLVTLKYNRARVWEDTNQDEKAKEAYGDLLKDHPTYLDCYLRLGCIAMKAGNYAGATDSFSEVLAVDKDNANAWSLLGLVHMKKNEWKPCQKKFERILTNTE